MILDTNVVSEMMREVSDARVAQWIKSQRLDVLYLSAITVAELRSGVMMLPHGRRRNDLESRLEGEVLPKFSGRVLAFDESCTRTYASLLAVARARGIAVAPLDACIAAIALTHGYPVATRDVTPFHAVGVEIVNPFLGGH